MTELREEVYGWCSLCEFALLTLRSVEFTTFTGLLGILRLMLLRAIEEDFLCRLPSVMFDTSGLVVVESQPMFGF